MKNHNIKDAVVIYNPVSTSFKKSRSAKITNTFKKYGIPPDFEESKYQGHLIELIKDIDKKDRLIITLGGDGTVSESYIALNEINQEGIYAHIPTGTTNDMAKNYNVKYKDVDKILEDILQGEITALDSFKINNEIVAYISLFGYLSHIPYATNPFLKRKLGHLGYVITGLGDMIKNPIPNKFNISYETDTKKGNETCILGAISNSIGFAGIDLYKDVKLDDGKIELLLVKELNPSLIATLAKDYFKNDIDLRKYREHIITDSTSKIKLTFEGDKLPKHPFNNDGEKSSVLPTYYYNEFTIEMAKPIKIMKSKKNAE